MKKIEHILATNVLLLRKHFHWNQDELSKRSGISQRTISNIENASNLPDYSPRIEAIEGVAKAFNIDFYTITLDTDISVILDKMLSKTIDNYLHTNKQGRENINRTAENEARYSANDHNQPLN